MRSNTSFESRRSASAAHFDVRPSYGRKPQEFPRLAVAFCKEIGNAIVGLLSIGRRGSASRLYASSPTRWFEPYW